MKNFKRFTAAIAATLMAASLSVPMAMNVSAATVADGETGNTITITTDPKGLTHSSMAAYQVFAGEYDATNDQLVVSGWGDGINVTAFIDALKADPNFNVATGEGVDAVTENAFSNIASENNAVTAQQVSDIVGKWTSDGPKARAFAKLAVANVSTTSSGTFSDNKIAGIPDGYYVIKDTAAATKDDNTAFTLGLLAVAGGENVTLAPKTDYPTVVKKVKEDDITTDDGFGEGYNDVADWDINTPVPFKIIGSMPSNIGDYDHYYMEFSDEMDNSFSAATITGVTVGSTPLTDTQYAIVTKALDNTLDDNDFKVIITDIKGLGIDISASTKVTVEYTAKINSENAVIGRDGQQNFVDLTYSNNPNNTGNGTSKPEDTGKTPKDKVIVFTYEVDINKIDGNTEQNLAGAQFKLSNGASGTDEKWAEVVDNKFVKWVDTKDAGTALTTNDDGMIKIIGIDDGTYKLYELNWSEEYNIPEKPFTIVLNATTIYTQNDYENAEAALTDISGTVAGENATVIKNAANKIAGIKGTIENNKGTTLPSTGGIGTTLFFLGGGSMAAVAGIFLITKKRMGKSAE